MKLRFRIKIGFLALAFIVSLLLTAHDYFWGLIFSVAIHELGHISMAWLCKIPISEFKLGLFGATILPQNTLFSYNREILLCLGGPLFNFLSASLALNIFSSQSSFVLSSLALGTLNLLPIADFDGGRILSAILKKMLPINTALCFMKVISFISVFSLWTLSLYLLLRIGSSLPLFIFCLWTFAKIFCVNS